MKGIRLILLILVGTIVLTGCTIIVTVPDWPPVTPSAQCSLTVTAGYWVRGTICYQIISTGEIVNTGQYIDSGINQVTIYNMPCGKEIWIYLVDVYNCISHVELIILGPGPNFAHFY